MLTSESDVHEWMVNFQAAIVAQVGEPRLNRAFVDFAIRSCSRSLDTEVDELPAGESLALFRQVFLEHFGAARCKAAVIFANISRPCANCPHLN
ncbi:MAG: hypothetical protein F9K25_17160 [Candidatus Contendobacter sp.]|nr:MAG: hypothetical protein F9K25_17160 [Candidatus Contendobacter sp.]